ncbi:MAG: NAD-dependent epimerase/dehydratase family protein [Myxococcales bacterium]|nr:NAD-dependent epimerase/dehydratase family protein [Myxococcales bacterium]
MKVLVIGGTGFVSGAIARTLHARGHEVIAYHRGNTAGIPQVQHVCSPDAAIPVMRFPSLDVDVVVHAVAVGDADARAAVAAFPRARMIALSSGDVYKVYGAIRALEEAPPAGALDEDSPLRTVEYPYGRSAQTPWGVLRDYEKLHVERAVLGAGGTVLRLGKVYGPGDRWLDAMTDRIVVQRPQWRWTHVFVEDVAQAVALAVENPTAVGRIYNVGESDTPTQLERMTLLARLRGLPLEAGEDERIPDLVLDGSRIRRELGFIETPPEAALGTGGKLSKGVAE